MKSPSSEERNGLRTAPADWSRCAVGDHLGLPYAALVGGFADTKTDRCPNLKSLVNKFALNVKLGNYAEARKAYELLYGPEFDEKICSLLMRMARALSDAPCLSPFDPSPDCGDSPHKTT